MPDKSAGQELGELVAEIFRTVLGRQSLALDEDFFAAGGGSLLAVDASARLSEAIGSEVDPFVIFRNPTAASCAAEIARLSEG